MDHRSPWHALWLLTLVACARPAVPSGNEVGGAAPASEPTAARTAGPTATGAVRPTLFPTAEPESGPLSHSGSGSQRSQRFHLRTGDYAIRWEAQPLLPSGIGCSLRGSLQPAEGETVGQFEDQVVPGEDRFSGRVDSFHVPSGDYILDVRSDCRWTVMLASGPSPSR